MNQLSLIIYCSPLIILSSCIQESVSTTFDSAVHYLEPGEVVEIHQTGLQIFCHNAKSKYLVHVWKSLNLYLRTNLDTYEVYDGKTPGEVREKHEYNKKSWTFNFFGAKKNKMINISPFEDICIGIYAQKVNNQYPFEVSLRQSSIDIAKITQMIIGIIVFWYAYYLSRNTLFYYICGILLGVTTSVLILIYFISKLFPKGKFMYLTAITGYTMSVYLIQMLWDNAQLIAKQYKDWVIYYILATSVISFMICYRFGPVTNDRTKQLIQWFLQALGLIMIYYSSYFIEASTGFCVILVLAYNFPSILFNKGIGYWKKIFPERRKLLSEDEYREEGIRETKHALEGLKQYCSSPECNTWKMVLKLKDPIRFAKFVEGDSHLLDDEAEAHDTEITKLIEENELTDDEDYDY